MYAEYLLWRGFRVALSDNSAEAIAMAFELRPDLVCTSFVLGEQNGIELCAALNADERTTHIPVIIMTTRTTDADLGNVRNSGCQAVLIKPCLPKVLVTEAKRLITASRRQPGGSHRPGGRVVRAPVPIAGPRPSRRS
jgi:DNA-binding response OmpR family regulator